MPYRFFLSISLFLLVILINFQNCSPPQAIVSGSEGAFLKMTEEDAKTAATSYETACDIDASTLSSFPALDPDAVLQGTTNTIAQISSVATVSGLGNVNLYGTDPESKVNELTGFSGNFILCQASADNISNSSGNIVVHDGKINSVRGFEGNLIIYGGSFPDEISNFKGNIIVFSSDTGTYEGRQYFNDN